MNPKQKKNRYPTFIEALRDLDDCLTMISLFATLPREDKLKVRGPDDKASRLCLEFKQYVIASRSLRKVFLSIKGIYYQAEILGQTVTWITPYDFPQKVNHYHFSLFIFIS
jgi:pescadillo protein